MTSYILRRLAGMVPALFLLLFLVVLMVKLLPGDAITQLLEGQIQTKIDRQQLEKRLGLDQPAPIQYAQYVGQLARGSFGKSLWTRQSVNGLIKSRAIISLELAVIALVISLSFALPLGIISAIKQNTFLDYGLRSFAVLALSVPNFVIGTIVVVLPAIYFHWTPPLFFTSFSRNPEKHLTQFIVPAIILGLALSGSVTRITRTMVLEVLRQDYIRTARSKGLKERSVIVRHALKNSLIPVMSVLGVQIAALISGSVIIENIFALPGMGRLLIQSIQTHDYPVIQGITVVVGAWVMMVNLVIDISYGLLDPRIRLAHDR